MASIHASRSWGKSTRIWHCACPWLDSLTLTSNVVGSREAFTTGMLSSTSIPSGVFSGLSFW